MPGRYTPPKKATEELLKAVKTVPEIPEMREEEGFEEGEEEFAASPSEFLQRVEERKAAKENTKVSIAESPAFSRNTFAEEKKIEPEPAKKTTGRRPIVIQGTKEELVAKRTQQWTQYIVEDFNPLLVKYTSTWIGIPDNPPSLALQPNPFLDGVILAAIDPRTNKPITFWDPPLRQRLELSNRKAEKLARAAAEFSVSPMGVAIVTWVETHQFMIAMGSALFVAAQYGWVLMQTKTEVGMVKEIVKQQTEAMQNNRGILHENGSQNMNPEQRLPGFNEPSTSYDINENP